MIIREERIGGQRLILGAAQTVSEVRMSGTITLKNGSQPRPIGRYASVSEAARKLGVTRQEAKRILWGMK